MSDIPKAPADSKDEPIKGGHEATSQHKTITIPAGRTNTGKPETVQVKGGESQTLAEALSSQPEQPKQPQYKKADFGSAGSLKVETAGQAHQGISGAEVDVVLRISKTETLFLRGIPARFLEE